MLQINIYKQYEIIWDDNSWFYIMKRGIGFYFRYFFDKYKLFEIN